MEIKHYVICEYCDTTQNPGKVLICLGCGALLKDNGPRFPGISDIMRDKRMFIQMPQLLLDESH